MGYFSSEEGARKGRRTQMYERRECCRFLSGLGFWPRPAFLGEVKRNQTKDQDDQTA